jgi:hypothetical protein
MAKIAIQTCRVPGQRTLVKKGKAYPDDDPVVKSHPDLFETAEEAQERQRRPMSTADLPHRQPVEQATAAPGEVRNVRHYCDVKGCRSWSTSEEGLAEHAAEAHA